MTINDRAKCKMTSSD